MKKLKLLILLLIPILLMGCNNQKEEYTIIFDSTGGSEVASKVIVGKSKLDLPTPEREGYKFEGWFEGLGDNVGMITNNTLFSANRTIYAKWSVKSYIIRFESNGGSVVKPIVQEYDTILSKPTDPTKEGYTFAGWYSDELLTESYTFTTVPANHLTIYAKWTINTYTISFNNNGGTETESITQDYGTRLGLPQQPTKEGYLFQGWFRDESLEEIYTFRYMEAENITLYAKWIVYNYTITFDVNGGSEIHSISQGFGTKVIKPQDPTKEGFTFVGWYRDVKLTDAYSFDTITFWNITLYAKWIETTYTISFESDGGNLVEPITQFYNTTVTKPNDPLKDGYTFIDWYSDKELKIPYVFSMMPNKDIILYAKWQANTYTINFNLNGGSDVSSITQDYNTKITKPAIPTKDGYMFAGWYKDQDFKEYFEFTLMPSEDITLYAKWSDILPVSLGIIPNIEGNRIKITAIYKLSALVLPTGATGEVLWESSDDSIAVIDDSGYVYTGKEGIVTFSARSIQNDEIKDSITIEFYWDVMDIIDYIVVEKPIIQKAITVYGFQSNYNVDIIGSVSNYYFGNYQQYEKIIKDGSSSRPGTIKKSTEYIVVSDSFSTLSYVNAAFNANNLYGGIGGASWHYSVGNDGIWQHIPNDEVAYHAGDGSRDFSLTDTGIKVTSKIKPIVEIDSNGYYTLNGLRTTILAPTYNGTILSTKDINDQGITLEIGENGNWMMGGTWYSANYKTIVNIGGNKNSIGIIHMVNKGSDLYLTWQYTAKRAVELALEYNLGVDRIKTQQFFNGKNSLQTLNNNNLYDNFSKMLEAEYLVNKFLADYDITFVSNNPEIVDNTGRILKIPLVDTEVSYSITITNTLGFNKSKLYYSTIVSK